jgi:hypothetical protein
MIADQTLIDADLLQYHCRTQQHLLVMLTLHNAERTAILP